MPRKYSENPFFDILWKDFDSDASWLKPHFKMLNWLEEVGEITAYHEDEFAENMPYQFETEQGDIIRYFFGQATYEINGFTGRMPESLAEIYQKIEKVRQMQAREKNALDTGLNVITLKRF